MSQIGSTYNEVHWTAMQGNKYMKTIHPAMLSVNGYKITQKARAIGNTSVGANFYVVHYDRDYVVCWLKTKVVKPLSTLSLKELITLIKEAHEVFRNPKQEAMLLNKDSLAS